MTRARRGPRSSAGRARPRSRRERGPSPTSWRMHKGRMEGRAKGNAGNSERRFERRARPQRSPQSLIADHTGRLGRVRVLLFPVLLPWATPYGRSNRAVAAVTYQVRAIGQVGAGVCASACDGIAPPQPQGTIRERRRRLRRDSSGLCGSGLAPRRSPWRTSDHDHALCACASVGISLTASGVGSEEDGPGSPRE